MVRAKGNCEMKRAPVQGTHSKKIPPGTIEWTEHEEVYAVYALQFGRSQSAERIAERGGFGYEEAEKLLGRPLKTWIPHGISC